jgi:hypothetical protein
MAYFGSIEITDAAGWRKIFQVEKARLMVGSADFNDLVLPEEHGSGVYPAHMQLFFTPGNPSKLRMVSLADTAMIAHRHLSEGDIVIPARGAHQIQNGDSLIVGDYLLNFHLHAQPGITHEARSEHLIMVLELPRLELRTEDSLVGRLQVVNHGELANCQFEFDLEGLDDDCYAIDPAPLLFPGSCEFLKIRFFHRGSFPPAGPCPFTLRAYAPTSYPTEEISISETLFVQPVYQYEVEIADKSAAEAEAPEPVIVTQPRPEPLTIASNPVEPAAKPMPVSRSGAPQPGARIEAPPTPPAGGKQIPVTKPESDSSGPIPPTSRPLAEPKPPAATPEPSLTAFEAPPPEPEVPISEPPAGGGISAEVAAEIGVAPSIPEARQTPQPPRTTPSKTDQPISLPEQAEPADQTEPEPPALAQPKKSSIEPSSVPDKTQTETPPTRPAPRSQAKPTTPSEPVPPPETPPLPENVVLEPPEKDLWASETSTMPRATSATPVSRLSQLKKSSLLAGQEIEILKAEDEEEIDETGNRQESV